MNIGNITAHVSEVTSDTGDSIGAVTVIREDRVAALVFEAAKSLETVLRTRFDDGDDVYVTIGASTTPV